MRLIQIPCLSDNAAWLVVDEAAVPAPAAFVVDPSEAPPVLARLERDAIALQAIVLTHHHADHTGGTADLVAATGCRVIGHAADADRLPRLDLAVRPGDDVEVLPGRGVILRVLDVHAHTRAHVAYAMEREVERVTRHGHGGIDEDVAPLAHRPALFVGDTLFTAGCGRLFEGTPAELHAALSLLARQDPRSLVCCGHEYTAKNLDYARHALPDNAAIRARSERLDVEMARARSALPGTLEEELVTNPFLLALPHGVDALAAMRLAKDAFPS